MTKHPHWTSALEDPSVDGYSTARVLLSWWSFMFFVVLIFFPAQLTAKFIELYGTIFLCLTSWAAGSKMVASYTAAKKDTQEKEDVG